MYQGFDIFAIFSIGPTLEVVVTRALKIILIVYLWLCFLPPFFFVFIHLSVATCFAHVLRFITRFINSFL